jgi:NADH-quinone oxidoreductase subunit C
MAGDPTLGTTGAPGDDAEVPAEAPKAPEPERLHGVLIERDSAFSRGQLVAHPTREQYVDFVRTLRDEDDYWMCLDVTVVDYLAFEAPRHLPEGVEPERFELVTQVIDKDRRRLRIRVQVPADDPTVPTLFDVHPGSEALEREAFDMFGIRFDGHPDLTRILMPEDWDGHPLRKDYAVGRIPVQFKGVRSDR